NNDSPTQTTITQGHNQIIHVRQDSASELEALFNTVMNPNFKSKSLPMKARNLPKSFFTQPDKPRQTSMYHHGHSHNFHFRSKSSPASLQLMDVGNLTVKASDIPADMPLPAGWSAAKTADGQQYYMNHNDRSTTWEDPRIPIIKQQRQSQVAVMQSQSVSGNLLPPPAHSNPGHNIQTDHSVTPTDPHVPSQVNQMDMSSVGQSRPTPMPPQQQSMLKHLVQEKEHLMRRQLLKQKFHPNPRNSPQPQKFTPTPEIHPSPPFVPQLSNPGMDGFMGQGNPSFHQRDASLDSGVGMGSNYSLPRTPDGFLNNVEEMETGTTQPQSTHHAANQRFPDFLDTLPASSVD
uniref:WW domain-containing protein n=1 Tax=Ciona savignyi TaxID=51511 RepID=H2Z0P3_CIOSA